MLGCDGLWGSCTQDEVITLLHDQYSSVQSKNTLKRATQPEVPAFILINLCEFICYLESEGCLVVVQGGSVDEFVCKQLVREAIFNKKAKDNVSAIVLRFKSFNID